MLTLLYANVSSGTCALRMHTCVQKTPLTHTHLCPRHGTIKGLEDNKLLGLIFVVYLRVLGDNAWRSGGRALRTWEHLLLLPCCVSANGLQAHAQYACRCACRSFSYSALPTHHGTITPGGEIEVKKVLQPRRLIARAASAVVY
jgi:hypothetical protein